jgi:hypothetical protein
MQDARIADKAKQTVCSEDATKLDRDLNDLSRRAVASLTECDLQMARLSFSRCLRA